MELSLRSLLSRPPVQVTIECLEELMHDYPRRNFQVRLWDGSTWGSDQQPRFTLVLKHAGALRAMFFSPSELTLSEAYIFDDFDVEGDIEAAFDLTNYLLGRKLNLPSGLRLADLLRKLPPTRQPHTGHPPATLQGPVHSKSRDRQAVRFHYDLSPEFFNLWLDRQMVYSCAYFTSEDQTDLDTAQQSKLDYICRKLRLRQGDCLLDIGCGWGALVIHAAAHYGVRAVGITLSVPQAEVARRRIQDSGLNERCRIEVCDYRDFDSVRRYDKLVSVGMFEHVGETLLPEYFKRAWQLLVPGGVFLNQGIAASTSHPKNGLSFIDHYVFPDGELVPISDSLGAAERSGFEVRDVESLREHYALTLHHWVHRLEAHSEEARRITGETTYRIWRLYMAASAHRFLLGQLNIYQVLLAKSLQGESGMPLTRTDWYRD